MPSTLLTLLIKPNNQKIMTKDQLGETLQRILKTDINLGFLLQIKKGELETLVDKKICFTEGANFQFYSR